MLALLLVALALAFDHTAYQQVLTKYVDSRGRVDYAGLKAAGALDGHVAALATAAEPAGKAERMAFWINAYNALTLDLVAERYPISSIRDLDGGKVWDVRTFTVAGRQVTLNDIENRILRPLGDPRIHAALNCASVGCAPLSRAAFTGAGLEGQLDATTQRWLSGGAVRFGAGSVGLSQIFEWYAADFPANCDIPGISGPTEGPLCFAAQHWPDQAARIRAGGYAASYFPYDWSLNKQ